MKSRGRGTSCMRCQQHGPVASVTVDALCETGRRSRLILFVARDRRPSSNSIVAYRIAVLQANGSRSRMSCSVNTASGESSEEARSGLQMKWSCLTTRLLSCDRPSPTSPKRNRVVGTLAKCRDDRGIHEQGQRPESEATDRAWANPPQPSVHDDGDVRQRAPRWT